MLFAFDSPPESHSRTRRRFLPHCEFVIQEAPELEDDETDEQNEDDDNNTTQDDITTNKPLTFRQIVGEFLVLGIFCATMLGFKVFQARSSTSFGCDHDCANTSCTSF